MTTNDPQPIVRKRPDGSKDPRWTLGMEYVDRGLERPTQFRKRIPRDERDGYERVEFMWGATKVVGYRPRTTPPASKRRSRKS
jgi:hypothetical protein